MICIYLLSTGVVNLKIEYNIILKVEQYFKKKIQIIYAKYNLLYKLLDFRIVQNLLDRVPRVFLRHL